MEDYNIKVTHIGNKYDARLFRGTGLRDEMACEEKQDIGWICREMLRWASRTGSGSKLAESARSRQTGKPKGKVFYIGA
jgi:hypothetical protein